MTLAAVSDAGPLSHLAEIDSLELLATFDTLLVPETVYKDVEAGGISDESADLSYALVEADESRVGAEELDAGERAAIAVERGPGPAVRFIPWPAVPCEYNRAVTVPEVSASARREWVRAHSKKWVRAHSKE